MGNAPKTLRAAVVGSGWGRWHAEAYRRHERVELAGLCGRSDSERSRKLAAELSIPLYRGIDDLLRKTKPDLVSVATQEPEHAQVTIAALEAGAHVYCEKAMAPTVEEAESMIAAAERNDRQLMIGYNYRFSPSARKLKEIVDAGKLGEIVFVTGMTFGYCLHHATDLVCHLVSSPVREVYASIERDAATPTTIRTQYIGRWLYSGAVHKATMLKFDSGAIATMISSDYMRFTHPALRLDVVGTKARAQMDDIVGRVTVFGEERSAEVWMPSLIADRLDLPSTTVSCVTAFVDSILEGRPVPVPGSDGLRMILLEEAIIESARENRPVELKR
ncbi:MAG: Gfo/Idh/MocA family protein [bacterium]